MASGTLASRRQVSFLDQEQVESTAPMSPSERVILVKDHPKAGLFWSASDPSLAEEWADLGTLLVAVSAVSPRMGAAVKGSELS